VISVNSRNSDFIQLPTKWYKWSKNRITAYIETQALIKRAKLKDELLQPVKV
jgi:hypothetical protein